MCEKILVKRLGPFATVPTRGSIYSAGLDLYAAQSLVIPAKGKGIVPTDISIELPENTYGRVAPRSGLAVKNHIHVGAGVIDRDYRGSIGIVLFNFSDVDFVVEWGDRVAQLIVEKICMSEIELVDNLYDTDRGSFGFGR